MRRPEETLGEGAKRINHRHQNDLFFFGYLLFSFNQETKVDLERRMRRVVNLNLEFAKFYVWERDSSWPACWLGVGLSFMLCLPSIPCACRWHPRSVRFRYYFYLFVLFFSFEKFVVVIWINRRFNNSKIKHFQNNICRRVIHINNIFYQCGVQNSKLTNLKYYKW